MLVVETSCQEMISRQKNLDPPVNGLVWCSQNAMAFGNCHNVTMQFLTWDRWKETVRSTEKMERIAKTSVMKFTEEQVPAILRFLSVQPNFLPFKKNWVHFFLSRYECKVAYTKQAILPCDEAFHKSAVLPEAT